MVPRDERRERSGSSAGRSQASRATARTRRARDRSARRVCVAIGVTRRRAVPAGTVGGRIACASTPRSSRAPRRTRIVRAFVAEQRPGRMWRVAAACEPERLEAPLPQCDRALSRERARGARARRRRRRAPRPPRATAAGGSAGREDEAPRAVHQQLDERAASRRRTRRRCRAPCRACPSAPCTRPRRPSASARPGAVRAEHAGRVGLVDHQPLW